MIRYSLVLAALWCFASPALGQPRDALEDRVNRALKFLKSMQEADGSWQADGAKSAAITGLAIMAFLSAGHVPNEGPYGDTVERGVRWLLAQQSKEGIFDELYQMYSQGICTLALAEVAGMTDAKVGRDCRKALEKAVKVILRAQAKEGAPKGGWRYTHDSQDADLSVTGWQLLALRAAKNVGCDVPVERIDRAVEYVRRCRDGSTPGFCYVPGGGMTVACTGTGILCLEICGDGKPRDRELLQAGSVLLKSGVEWNSPHFFYSIYYGAQATFQLGNNYWNVYRPQLHKTLFAHQQGNGSWIPHDGFGPSYGTAMGVLALTVEYRLLPIYQRHEEEPRK